jgi:cation diffusion facilitator family transporter
MTNEQFLENKRVQQYALLLGLILLALKFVAFFATNSNAILSDALESIVNVGAGAFGLFALNFSNRPRDKEHPYGHGKIEFLSAGFEGGLIFIAGLVIVMKGIYNFIEPQELQNLNLGASLAGIAGIINFVMGWLMERKGHENKSIVLIAGGKHLKSDAYSSVGLIIGVLLTIWTGYIWIDNLMAILFGAIIIYTGYKVLRKSFAGIMDEQDYDLIDSLVKRLNERRQIDWIDVHNLRIIKYGSKLHIDCHMTIPYYYKVSEAHEVVKSFENTIMLLEKDTFELFVHTDPCKSDSCKLCQKTDCPVRQFPFESIVQWNLDNTMENQKHLL